MVNYQLGKIYTVRSLTSPEIYVGSTVAPLCKRMAVHRCDWKKGLILGRNKEIVKDINEWYIELYENYPCDKVEELTAREGVIIREIGTLNKNIAGRTKKQYQTDHKEEIKQYNKQYHTDHKEEAKQYYTDNKKEIKQYYTDNKEKIKQTQKVYYTDNKEEIKQTQKVYYTDNKEEIKQYQKQYQTDHKEEIKQKKKKYYLKQKLAKSQIINT